MMRLVGHQQVRATCRRRPSAAFSPPLGRTTIHTATSRHLYDIMMSSGSFSSQGSVPHQRGRAAFRQLAAARVAAADDDDAEEAAASDAGAHAAEAKFSASLSALQAFVAQHWRLPLQREMFEGSSALGKWVTRQRDACKRGVLRPERVAALEALQGWAWAPMEVGWPSSLSSLKAFVAQHGRLPRRQEKFEGGALGAWVTRQRGDYRSGTLKPERAAALEAVPGWKWDPPVKRPSNWSSTLSILQDFVALHGRLPQRRDKFEGSALGSWATDQRTAHTKGELKPERVAALEAVPGWTWDAKEQAWAENLEGLRAFVAETGALPKKGERHNGLGLGTWVHTQREAYKKGKLSAERVAALESLPLWRWSGR